MTGLTCPGTASDPHSLDRAIVPALPGRQCGIDHYHVKSAAARNRRGGAARHQRTSCAISASGIRSRPPVGRRNISSTSPAESSSRIRRSRTKRDEMKSA
jgi:hypothetical protein